MIYVTGDTHGRKNKWTEQIEPVLHDGDTVIVCGDFGVGFWAEDREGEEAFYDHLASQNYTVLFLDGNHENFDQLNDYPTQVRYDGNVHVLRDNVLHLMRGEMYEIEGVRIFVFGGGHSMDQAFRKEGVSWWPQEMPSLTEYEYARQNLKKAENCVDYILTHTAPSQSVYYLSTIRSLGIKSVNPNEMELTTFLDEIQRSVSYMHWYFGHLHVDFDLWREQTALFNTVREMKSGWIVRKWSACEEQEHPNIAAADLQHIRSESRIHI